MINRSHNTPNRLLLTAFDKGWAVLEHKPGLNEHVPVAWLPKGTKVGAVLEFMMAPGPKETTVVSGMSRVGERVGMKPGPGAPCLGKGKR